MTLDLLLDEPAKLLEEPPHWPSATDDTCARGDRAASPSPRRRSSPRLWPACLLMTEVRGPACLFSTVTTDTSLEQSGFALLRCSHPSSQRPRMWLSLSGFLEDAKASPIRVRAKLPKWRLGAFHDNEDKSEAVALDTGTLNVLHRWPMAPCEAPSELAIDREHRRLFAGADQHVSRRTYRRGP